MPDVAFHIPSLVSVIDPVLLPRQISRSRASECQAHLLGYGSRMEVYPLIDEQTVLRVPRRTEQQLIAESGSSGRVVLATGHAVSAITDTELFDLDAVAAYIGSFIPDTTPFPDFDLDGHFRYYALQRRVHPIRDLVCCSERLDEAHSRSSLERFIRDVRDLHASLQLLPDLVGKGNLVLDRYGMVKLIDVNNFCRLTADDSIDSAILDEDIEHFIVGRKQLRAHLPKGFLDSMGCPIAELTLHALHMLEVRGLGRDLRSVDRDPFYRTMHSIKRQRILSLLRDDTA